MTAAVSRTPEPYEVPEGGLGSFLTATVGDWSDEALNADNYYDIVKPTADQLAQFGREEDDRIAHVATGETIIPMAVFEEDPALKEALFTRMRDMGIDPERYIVGNELNSINPVTGQPEFFLKKIFKGIKKAVKGVVKVFKKVAPIVLSIGGAMLGGPLGAAIGSGIGTLIQGGDLKDAFKSALISGVTAGVTQGIGQGFEAAGSAAKVAEEGGKALTFGEKLSAGLEGFGQSIGEGIGAIEGTSYLDQLSGMQGIMNPTGRETPAEIVKPDPTEIVDTATGGPQVMDPQAGLTAAKSPTNQLIEQKIAQRRALESVADASGAANVSTGSPTNQLIEQKIAQRRLLEEGAKSTADSVSQTAAEGIESLKPYTGTAAEAASTLAKAGQISQRGFFGSMKDFFTSFGTDIDALKQAFLPDQLTPEAITNFFKNKGLTLTDTQLKAVGEAVNPDFLRKYGPLFAGATFAADAAGLMDVPEMETLDDGGFGINQRFIANPLAYRTYAQAGSGYNAPPVGVANGGGMDTSDFPRRNGRISGPGTETSDDIPAMLSDGEFVMTAKAVRGAGNGSREAGMRKMYNMMSQFERAV